VLIAAGVNNTKSETYLIKLQSGNAFASQYITANIEENQEIKLNNCNTNESVILWPETMYVCMQ